MVEADKDPRAAELYCRRLGHEITLSYCITDHETGTEGTLCPLIRDCWHRRLPIDSFLNERFPEWSASLTGAPPDKISGLYRLIQKAQAAIQNTDSDDNQQK